MGCNKLATNWKSDKREEMALDWTYFEESRGRYREGGIGLESIGCTETGRPRKTWKKTVEEEAAEMGKTWKELKRLSNSRTRWRGFIDALCSS
jgi:hypothetical protein